MTECNVIVLKILEVLVLGLHIQINGLTNEAMLTQQVVVVVLVCRRGDYVMTHLR